MNLMRRRTAHQQTLADEPPQRRRRYCRLCGKELTAPTSRTLGYGPDCDPNSRTTAPDHHVDQDVIPGT